MKATANHLGLAALAAAAVLAGPASAHPEHGDKGEKKVERVIILSDHGKGDGQHARTERIHRVVTSGGKTHHAPGAHGEHRLRMLSPESCGAGDERSEVSESSPDGKEKTRILVCGKAMTAAARAEHLEKALARLQQNVSLSAEHKERVTAALREAIDRLRDTR